jgi:prevent-host-death family protein
MVITDRLVTMKAKEERVPAGEFKAKCLALFDQVEARRRSFVITKRGRPVARVVPLAAGKQSSLQGSLEPIEAKWEGAL